jgi:two-component system cell cycle sensor histidine kinase PleC
VAIPAGAVEPASDLARISQPAWLIDIRLACVIAANPEGATAVGGALRPGASLDRAMPALQTLRAIGAGEAGHDQEARLLVWTGTGTQVLHCRCQATGDPDVLLVVAADARLPAGTAHAGAGGSAEDDQSAAPDGGWERSLSTIAHELRTPLGAIAALAEFLMDEKMASTPSVRHLEYAADIHYTAQHALSVIDALLTGKDGGAPCAQTDVHGLVTKCLSAVRALAARAAVSLEPELPEQPVRLAMDPRLLTQILLNLLSNALKFTPAGGAIRVQAVLNADGGLELSVSDTGIGIDEDTIQRLSGAQPAKPAPGRSAGGGSGYGLALVKALASANGAQLRITGRPGEGTRVSLVFGKERVCAQ